MIVFYSKLKNERIAKGNHCVTVEAYKENDNIEVQVKDDDFIQNAPERLDALKNDFISREDKLYTNIDLNGLAPMNHASTLNDYGVATLTEYGHVKNIITLSILEEALKEIRAKKAEAIKAKNTKEPVVKESVSKKFKRRSTLFSFIEGTVKNRFKHWKEMEKGAYYRCGPNKIAAKSGTFNTPSPLKFSGFGFKIPKNARINKVILEYSDVRKDVTIGKPLIKFNGIKKNYSAAKGPATKWSSHTVTIKDGLTPDLLNKLNITLSYPMNERADEGYLYVKPVQVTVEYTI